MSCTRRAALGIAAFLFTARVARADAPPSDAFERIARARAKVRSLRGPFVQTRKLALFASDVRSTGEVILLRPDHLVWRLDPPDDVTFWVGPGGLSYRSAHGEGRMPSANAKTSIALDDLRTLLGGDIRKLGERWTLRVSKDTPEGVEIEATATSAAAAPVRRMIFSLNSDLTKPTRIVTVEGPNDETEIRFGDLRLNDAVAPRDVEPP